MPTIRFDRRATHNYLVYILIALLMVGTLLSWQAWTRTSNFRNFHQQLAITSVTGAVDELELLFSELQRSMRLFTDDQAALLENIARDSGNNSAWEQLEDAVWKHFPEYFGLTLTDTAGNVLRPDSDNKVGKLCQQDIHTFIDQGYWQQGYVHPSPLAYHFDIMVPWGNVKQPHGVFFLSFHPRTLVRILQQMQSPGHELLLLRRDRTGLIEVTGEGSRNQLKRETTLNPGELARIIYSLPVADSRWEVADLPLEKLFRTEAVHNWTSAALMFSAFVIAGLLMLSQLRHKEQRRLQAEEQALQHQNDLAHVDRLNIMGEMASGLAHELNQPLSAISTYCQAGLRIIKTSGEKPEKLVHALEQAASQALRAGKIIHRMRRFSSKGKVRRSQMDLNKVIRNAVSFVEPELDKKGITLQLELTSDLPPVVADSIQIEQVILNLLHNAIEAMVAGNSTIRNLAVTSRQTDTGPVEIMVHDTGPGLDTATVDRIFDTFFSTKEDGMGLGLAISHSIVEAHGGQLHVDSVTGAGTTFYFTLPVSGT